MVGIFEAPGAEGVGGDGAVVEGKEDGTQVEINVGPREGLRVGRVVGNKDGHCEKLG